jgi:hypothetical protein
MPADDVHRSGDHVPPGRGDPAMPGVCSPCQTRSGAASGQPFVRLARIAGYDADRIPTGTERA